MSDTATKYIAGALLLFMLGLAFFSMQKDSAIMDEVAHLPAGYSYITQKDMRINPEHPPLIKDLAGLGVLISAKISGSAIKFPSDIKSWTTDINGQWDFGFDFMYKEGNPADLMLLGGRLPMLFILLILGLYIFRWTRQLWGKAAALIALFFYSFSPTFLAHGRFVTTDVAAAAAVFISTFYFIRWLKNPKAWHLISAGIFFGLALLAKFSTFLLVPFFLVLTIIWIIIKIFISAKEQANAFVRTQQFAPPQPPLSPGSPTPQNPSLYQPKQFVQPQEIKKDSAWQIILKYIGGVIIIFFIGYALIMVPVYMYHVKNYPPERQKADMEFVLASYSKGPPSANDFFGPCKTVSRIGRCPAQIAIWTADKNIVLRAFGQYLYGLLMVLQRASGGNTTYFLGQVSAAGSRIYFPVVYMIKEPLAFHVLTAFAILIALYFWLKKRKVKNMPPSPEQSLNFSSKIILWANRNFEILAMMGFILLYWGSSVRSPLNIGVRHILPTFPLIYALVASQIAPWLRPKVSQKKIIQNLKYTAFGLLAAWQVFSVITIFPSFLAYFNELAGGPQNGYKYAADSNLDWGQDLIRLNDWAEEQGIQKIYVDYFGGGDTKYYLGDKYQPWWGDRNPNDLSSGDWLAVSATFLDGGTGQASPGYKDPTGYYNWLNKYQPKAVIGYSIFVYQIP